jgi:hypothetical protein
MSLSVSTAIYCDAPRCSASVFVPSGTQAPYPVPAHWIRVCTWDAEQPWETREYDACSNGCLLAIQGEAMELREALYPEAYPEEEVDDGG